jgi:squalene synthase HpnC
MTDREIREAREAALRLAKSHYENFPVVSVLIRKELRADVAAIYWFARTADDLADEGDAPPKERLARLDEFESRLTALLAGEAETPIEAALAHTVHTRRLDPRHFYDLLSAFKQDVVVSRYADFDELLDYCRRSANPVGRLLLELYDVRDEEAARRSDDVCTALQLANFYQDLSLDLPKGRVYIPQNELVDFGANDTTTLAGVDDSVFRDLMRFQVERASRLFDRGRGVLPYLKGRIRMEIKWTILGGERILEKIRRLDYDTRAVRPALGKLDFFLLSLRSIL